MKLTIDVNTEAVKRAMAEAASQVPYALSVAINKAADRAKEAVKQEMPRVFDRPTPWVINSLRLKRSTKTKLTAEVAFKDINSALSARTMIEPHVDAGTRNFKAFEVRLLRVGLLPKGYNAVPGAAARLDANGNMSRGQISQLLNVLGAYFELGYNKADARTKARLKAGNQKKNQYGFAYWVNPVAGQGRAKHLPPGVYQRVYTAFGTSLKPVLIFVRRAQYKKRLNFYGITKRVFDAEFHAAFEESFAQAKRTALLKNQGSPL
jgi:hypothetical protein